MKKFMFLLTAAMAGAVISCNNSGSSHKNDMGMNHDSMSMQDKPAATGNLEMATTTFASVDPATATYIRSLVTDYVTIKNALVNANEGQAASASGKMQQAMKNHDHSNMTAEQRKVYDDIESGLIENAEHISKTGIVHQREYFASMSKEMYDMVKAFGAGMPLYHDHCPMYKNGSMWLSETREIKNPFYGDKMMSCGNMVEMLK